MNLLRRYQDFAASQAANNQRTAVIDVEKIMRQSPCQEWFVNLPADQLAILDSLFHAQHPSRWYDANEKELADWVDSMSEHPWIQKGYFNIGESSQEGSAPAEFNASQGDGSTGGSTNGPYKDCKFGQNVPLWKAVIFSIASVMEIKSPQDLKWKIPPLLSPNRYNGIRFNNLSTDEHDLMLELWSAFEEMFKCPSWYGDLAYDHQAKFKC